MRIAVHAVGRMKAGPEQDLAARYFDRFAKSGGAISLDFAGIAEIAESRAANSAERKRAETGQLIAALPAGSALIILDERGRNLGSEEIAARIAGMRDAGTKHVTIAIGGPDGHDPAARERAELVLSLGAQTWPHQLVRVMLAEQLYRVATILSGHPYHRA